jgi:hypothetical protein
MGVTDKSDQTSYLCATNPPDPKVSASDPLKVGLIGFVFWCLSPNGGLVHVYCHCLICCETARLAHGHGRRGNYAG